MRSHSAAPVSPEEASQVMPCALACWAMARKDATVVRFAAAEAQAENGRHIVIDRELRRVEHILE